MVILSVSVKISNVIQKSMKFCKALIQMNCHIIQRITYKQIYDHGLQGM